MWNSKRTGCIIFDEKHEYTDVQNMNTLQSGLGKVWHGRVITITTDGHVRGGVLDQEKEQNQAILKEYNPLNRTLVFWCRIEDEKEWNQIDKLVKAIPSLNDFLSLRSTIQKEILDMPYKMDYVDVFEIAEKIDKLIASGMYCIDELRRKLGETELNTEESKKHWITKNYEDITTVQDTGNKGVNNLEE